MLVDDIRVLEVTKDIKGKQRVGKRGLKTTSGAGMMTVSSVDETGMVMTAKVMQWLAGKRHDPTYMSENTNRTKRLASLHQR